MLDFSVKQVEGLEENLSYAGLYITVDSNLIDVITPLTQPSLQTSIKIPSSGKLHLILKNMRESDKFIGSIKIDLLNLPLAATWLPIFDNLDFDSLQSIPEKIDCPRILVEVCGNLGKVGGGQSAGHDSGSFIEKIKSLQLKIMDLEHTLASERWEFQREIGSLSSSQRYREDSQAQIIEQQKAQIEKQEALINDLIAQRNDFHSYKDKEKTSINSLQETVLNVRKEYERTLVKSQERDLDYLARISEMSRENFELKMKIEKLMNEIFQKDLNIENLNEKIKHMAGDNLGSIIRKQREKINTSHEYLKDSEDSRNNLQRKIEELIEKITNFNQCSNCEKNREMFNELSRQISSLKVVNRDEVKETNNLSFDSFFELESFNKDLPDTKKIKNFIQVYEKQVKEEEIIESELRNHQDSFIKISDGQYLYNKTLKVNIFVENSSILCRVGKIFTLPEFINSFSQGVSVKILDHPANFSKLSNETGTCENSFSEEDKKEEEAKKKDLRIKPNLIKSQFKPDKKSFIPLRQTSNHNEKKRIVSK